MAQRHSFTSLFVLGLGFASVAAGAVEVWAADKAPQCPAGSGEPLILRDDVVRVTEGDSVSFDVLHNDKITVCSAVNFDSKHLGSQFRYTGSGTFIFTPGKHFRVLPEGRTVEKTLNYTVLNDAGETQEATVRLIIEGRNSDPIVVAPIPDRVLIPEESVTEVDLSQVFEDEDHSDRLDFTVVRNSDTSVVDVVIDGEKMYIFTHEESFGRSHVVVQARDRQGATISTGLQVDVGGLANVGE